MDSAVPFGHPEIGLDHSKAAAHLQRSLVLVVDPRVLTGQCLVVALQAADPSTRFAALGSLASLDDAANGATVLALCVPAGGDVKAACQEARQKLGPDRARLPLVIMADDESSATVLGCMEAGACGYIPTSMTVEMVVQVLKLVQTGCTFVPSSVVRSLNKPSPAAQPNTVHLNSTQLQIADWIRKGSPNKVIAHQLGMSENTVKVHVRAILRKMKVRNRTELSYRSYDLAYMAASQEHPPADPVRAAAGHAGLSPTSVIVAG